jgi:hypothetical protein
MKTIGQSELWSLFDSQDKSRKADSVKIRKGEGHPVTSFLDLAKKVAELQFRNRDIVLLFRGQPCDYLTSQGNTSLKPTLFRSIQGGKKNPPLGILERRFEILENAERELVRLYTEADLVGLERLKRYRILRWSLLQHYEVCDTPLLDVTHSLRIAASFASVDDSDEAYIYVLGVPNLSGAVTASAEGGLQIIRLASVCPPAAVRPHIQEGYLLGVYPDIADIAQKKIYRDYEIDFGLRLVAKFVFKPRTFWKSDSFPSVPREALYPDKNDPLFALAQQVKASIDITED